MDNIISTQRMLKKALIITYYWPPSGGSGVQRWLKFVKYLRDYGVEPVIYTPKNPELMAVDKALEAEIPAGVEVIKQKITEPYNLYKLLTGKKEIKPGFINQKRGKRGRSFKESLSLFLRSNVFIPDPKALWIRPSVKVLTKYLYQNSVDVIISTGPPHSMHLIAKKVSAKTGIPWIADFRDPWTGMYNFKHLKHTWLAELIHRGLEKGVIKSADAIVVVTNGMRDEFAGLGGKNISVITNGFDELDFPQNGGVSDKEFSITYTGLFFKDRNPSNLWRVLAKLANERSDFKGDLKIRLVGNTDASIKEEIAVAGLADNLFCSDYIPHNEVIKIQQNAQILMLSSGMEPESKSILTGKFFEYLAARRPILAFGYKESDIADALRETNAGILFDYTQEKDLSEWIENRYLQYKGDGIPSTDGQISRFSRRSLTGDMVKIINSLTD